ncbi:MAG: RNA polymerase sigma factor [Oscillospiraceae bacterium]|nr:RNA polymerase sigma factor [Oscillospiraceae bacterium]
MFDAGFAVIEDEKQRSELAVFYAENKSRFFYIAVSKLHNREDAEDAVQEAFSRIADKPERFFGVPREKRVAYVDVIVRNVAVDLFERRNKTSEEQLEDEPVGTVTLEDGLFDRISRDEILAFVDGMPTLQRNVLWLHCILGLSIDETAQRLNVSVTVANKRLALARRSVREFVERSGSDD